MNAFTNGAGNLAGPSLAVLYGLNVPFMQVRAFHQAFEHPCPTAPTEQSLDRSEARANWIREECQELQDARTLQDQADAYIDIIYFGLGGLVELGILPQAVFDCVQDANMAKLHRDENGKGFVKRREDGKVIKPDGWEENHAPERHIAAEIDRQSKHRPLADFGA